MLGNQQMFSHQRTGEEAEDKTRRSFRQATVRSLLRSKIENRMTGGDKTKSTSGEARLQKDDLE